QSHEIPLPRTLHVLHEASKSFPFRQAQTLPESTPLTGLCDGGRVSARYQDQARLTPRSFRKGRARGGSEAHLRSLKALLQVPASRGSCSESLPSLFRERQALETALAPPLPRAVRPKRARLFLVLPPPPCERAPAL